MSHFQAVRVCSGSPARRARVADASSPINVQRSRFVGISCGYHFHSAPRISSEQGIAGHRRRVQKH